DVGGVALARERELPRRRIDALHVARRAALDQKLGEGAIAAADVDAAQAFRQRQPIEEDIAGEATPDAHHGLVAGAILESDWRFGHGHTSIHAPSASADLKTASSAAAVCRRPAGGIGNAPCPIAALAK